jgi:hypothetical protein
MKKVVFLSIFICCALALSAQKNTSKKSASKKISYADIVSKTTKTDAGLFKVHQKEDKYYYEIPKSTLGKDMLLITRIKDIPAGLGVAMLMRVLK